MRRLLLILLVAVVVNVPWAHQRWSEHRLDTRGQDVEARVVASGEVNGRYFLDFTFARSVDPERERFGARVDEQTWQRARETKVLAVRVLPGDPSTHRPEGEVTTPVLGWVALGSDLILLLVVVLWWLPRRRRDEHEVLQVAGDEVRLRLGPAAAEGSPGPELTCLAPRGWVAGSRVGDRVRGRVHLVAEGDVLPGLALGDVEQGDGVRQLLRGQVVDARTSYVDLRLSTGQVVRVETGPFRNRADLREVAQVSGTVMFTPRGGPLG